jgi:hypothetical protein
VAFDGHRLLRVSIEPPGLVCQDALRLTRQRRAILLEVDQIPDIYGKFLGRTRGCHGAGAAESVFLRLPVAPAGRKQQSKHQDACKLAGVVNPTTPTHYWLLPLAKF